MEGVMEIKRMVIYRITSPKGKKYIGQTTQTFEKRMRGHINAALRGDDEHSCKLVNRAIRKYGWERMIKEVIIEFEGTKEQLDLREIALIELECSLTPNGYNISKGGAGCVYDQSDQTKQKRSESLRTREDTKDLPMYVKYRKTAFSEGYIYEKPGKPAVQFTSPHLTMEEKKKQVIEYVEKLKENPDLHIDQKRTHEFDFELAPHISYQKRMNGFVVVGPGIPRKSFSNKKLTLKERYDQAKAYLDSIVI
jgi:group I intron endonuclease